MPKAQFPQDVAAPVAPQQPVTIKQHGEERVDNYAWMRAENWQTVLRDPEQLDTEIRKHLESENAYFEAMTASDEPLRERLVAEMRGRIKEDDTSVPLPDGPWLYGMRFREGGEYPVFHRAPVAEPDAQQTLLDGEARAEGADFYDLGGVSHSPDHRLLAFGEDRLGSEYFTLYVYDIENDTLLKDQIPNSDGDAVWAADSRSFFYIERDDNQRPRRVRQHHIGAAPGSDRIVYEEADEGFFLGVDKSSSGDFILIETGNRVSSETWWLPADEADSEATLIAKRRADERYEVDHHGDYLYILTDHSDAKDYQIMRAPLSAPGRENWQTWIAHKAGRSIQSIVCFANWLVRYEQQDGLPRIVISDYEGSEHHIEFDEAAYALGLNPGYEFDTSLLRFSYESPSTPTQIFDFDMATHERVLRKQREVPSGHDPALYLVERFMAPSHDGAEVPVITLRHRDTIDDGPAPLLLFGYGSYGTTMPAAFRSDMLSLVDRGVVFALAQVRGGDARGQQWYEDGKLGNKQNTFSDFNAAARALIEHGTTAAGQIVSYGGSAGGMLVGACVNQAPELYAGVVAVVPFVDVLNTISDQTLPLTPPEWPEWGNPIERAEDYSWIRDYSPYENVSKQHYPPILATGGLTDFRVTYWEPAKWIAHLRDVAEGGPFLLHMNLTAGHGGTAARLERLRETAEHFAFALRVLGLEDVTPAPSS